MTSKRVYQSACKPPLTVAHADGRGVGVTPTGWVECSNCGCSVYIKNSPRCCRCDADLNPFPPSTISKVETRRRGRKSRRPVPPGVRRAVLERDGFCCARCGSKERLHVHHIKHRSDGGTDEPANLLTLCEGCHYQEHWQEPVALVMMKCLKAV